MQMYGSTYRTEQQPDETAAVAMTPFHDYAADVKTPPIFD